MHTPLTSNFDALPFLVVHGSWFWIVLMFALALTLTGCVVVTRHVVAVLRARRVIAMQRAAVVRTLSPGKGVFEGRWREVFSSDAVVLLHEATAGAVRDLDRLCAAPSTRLLARSASWSSATSSPA